MRTIILTALLGVICTASFAEMGYVSGYTRSNGTQVQGYYRDVSNDGWAGNNRKAVWGY